MFKKKTNSNNEVFPVTNIPHKVHSPLTDLLPDTTKTNTIIAAGTQLTGDVRLDGDFQIYGGVTGDIIVSDGTIRLMRSGKIEGNLTAPHITVDGRIEGVCISDHLEILENGRLNGIVKGSNFSIKKGGVVIGQSEITEEPASQNKVKVKPAVVVPQEKANAEEKATDDSIKQETKSYTVKAGDTLYNIALTHYGSGNADNQQLIRSANGISGNSIPVGTVLTIKPNN